MLKISLRDGRTAFAPGDTVDGTVAWEGGSESAVAVRLYWATRGKGTEDRGLVEEVRIGSMRPGEQRQFLFKFPEDGPYSFSGKLISLLWKLQAWAETSDATDELEIVLGPEGREVLLHPRVTA